MTTLRVVLAAVCVLSSCVAQSSFAQQVLFVTGNAPLSSADATVKSDLEAVGLEVQSVLDAASATSDADGKDLVLISESVLSTRVGKKFRDVSVPVVVYESHLYDDLGMSTNSRSRYGTVLFQRSVFVQGSHPLSGGLDGTVQVSTKWANLSWAKPGSEAIVAATLRNNRNLATIFGYEAGATLANGQTAPARRVGLFPHEGSIDNRTSASRDLFLAAVQWALSGPEDEVQLASDEPVTEPDEADPAEPEDLPVVEEPSQEPESSPVLEDPVLSAADPTTDAPPELEVEPPETSPIEPETSESDEIPTEQVDGGAEDVSPDPGNTPVIESVDEEQLQPVTEPDTEIPQNSYAKQVLFVTGDEPLSSSDITVMRDLEAVGMQVQTVLDSASATSDADGKNLVLISESVSSTRVGKKFSDVSVPVVVYESHLYDDLGMSANSRSRYGNVAAQKSISMQGAHPLTGGLSGTVQVSDTQARHTWAKPGSDAIVAATLANDSQRATIFGYEAGAVLANGQTAPARRVGLFPHVGSIDNRTSASRDLFMAAVQWALSGTEDEVQPPTTEPVNEPGEDTPAESEDPSVVEEPSQEPENNSGVDDPVSEEPTEPVDEPEGEQTPQLPESPPPVAELPNAAPEIADTSYQCDPVTESVAYNIGDADFFTLSVTDESPLTLKYDANSSNKTVASVSVDENGIFKVTALSRGEALLWLFAEDDNGLVDEFELRVVID